MNHSGTAPESTPGTLTHTHPEPRRNDSPASRARADQGTGSMEQGKGTGNRERTNSPTIPTSSTVPALLATLAGWLTGITQRLTDRHRPCRQAVDELSALVTAERDRQRQARQELANLAGFVALMVRVDRRAINRQIDDIAAMLDGPAPNPPTGLDLSNPQAPTNPSPGERHG